MPSAHQPSRVLRPDIDPDVTEDLLDSDSDDRTTLADIMKGKTGVDANTRSGSPDEEAATSCPKKPRTTVRKRKASTVAR